MNTKKHSTLAFFLNYVIIMLLLWLIFSAIVAIVWGLSYRFVLTHEGQPVALMFLYWWPPIFRMIDMEEHNKAVDKYFGRR